MRHNARAMKHNTQLTQKRQDNVMGMGAFRHALGYWKSKFDVGTRTLRQQVVWSPHSVSSGPRTQPRREV